MGFIGKTPEEMLKIVYSLFEDDGVSLEVRENDVDPNTEFLLLFKGSYYSLKSYSLVSEYPWQKLILKVNKE